MESKGFTHPIKNGESEARGRQLFCANSSCFIYILILQVRRESQTSANKNTTTPFLPQKKKEEVNAKTNMLHFIQNGCGAALPPATHTAPLTMTSATATAGGAPMLFAQHALQPIYSTAALPLPPLQSHGGGATQQYQAMLCGNHGSNQNSSSNGGGAAYAVPVPTGTTAGPTGQLLNAMPSALVNGSGAMSPSQASMLYLVPQPVATAGGEGQRCFAVGAESQVNCAALPSPSSSPSFSAFSISPTGPPMSGCHPPQVYSQTLVNSPNYAQNYSSSSSIGSAAAVPATMAATLHQPQLFLMQQNSFTATPPAVSNATTASTTPHSATYSHPLPSLPMSIHRTEKEAVLPSQNAGSPLVAAPISATPASTTTNGAGAKGLNGLQYQPGSTYEGYVKRYNPTRGFGFLTATHQLVSPSPTPTAPATTSQAALFNGLAIIDGSHPPPSPPQQQLVNPSMTRAAVAAGQLLPYRCPIHLGDIFVHQSYLNMVGFRSLPVGGRVRFRVGYLEGQQTFQAVDVELLPQVTPPCPREAKADTTCLSSNAMLPMMMVMQVPEVQSYSSSSSSNGHAGATTATAKGSPGSNVSSLMTNGESAALVWPSSTMPAGVSGFFSI